MDQYVHRLILLTTTETSRTPVTEILGVLQVLINGLRTDHRNYDKVYHIRSIKVKNFIENKNFVKI